jgi:hypothetical protein
MKGILAADAVDDLQEARRKRQRTTYGRNVVSISNIDVNNEHDNDEESPIEESGDVYCAWKKLLNNIKGSIPLKPLK